MNRTSLALLALSLCCGASWAQQKQVFRCTVDGRVTYSDAPCKTGTEINADDSRSETQRKAAEANVKRDEKMADKMRRERLADEALAAKQGAARIPYSAAEKAAASAPAGDKAIKKRKPPHKKPPVKKPQG